VLKNKTNLLISSLILLLVSLNISAIEVSDPKNHAYHSFVYDNLWGDDDEQAGYTDYTPDLPTIPANVIIDELYLKIQFDDGVLPNINRIALVQSCGSGNAQQHVFNSPAQDFYVRKEGNFLILVNNYVDDLYLTTLTDANCWKFRVTGHEDVGGVEVNITYHKPNSAGLQDYFFPDGYIDTSGSFNGRGSLAVIHENGLNAEDACNVRIGTEKLPPAGQSDNIVVMVHGWNPEGYTNKYAPGPLDECASSRPMESSSGDLEFSWYHLYNNYIKTNTELMNSDWVISRYDWSEDANTGFLGARLDFNKANEARDRSHVHGLRLGKILESQAPKKVQFIAHSAGNWAARRAADYLKKKFGSAITIEVTSLDPFVNDRGTDLSPDLTNTENNDLDYQSSFEMTKAWVDYAENYYVFDAKTDFVGGGSTSGNYYLWDENIQIDDDDNGGSAYQKSLMNNHSGPVYWYAETIAKRTYPGYKSSLAYRGVVGGWVNSNLTELSLIDLSVIEQATNHLCIYVDNQLCNTDHEFYPLNSYFENLKQQRSAGMLRHVLDDEIIAGRPDLEQALWTMDTVNYGLVGSLKFTLSETFLSLMKFSRIDNQYRIFRQQPLNKIDGSSVIAQPSTEQQLWAKNLAEYNIRLEKFENNYRDPYDDVLHFNLDLLGESAVAELIQMKASAGVAWQISLATFLKGAGMVQKIATAKQSLSGLTGAYHFLTIAPLLIEQFEKEDASTNAEQLQETIDQLTIIETSLKAFGANEGTSVAGLMGNIAKIINWYKRIHQLTVIEYYYGSNRYLEWPIKNTKEYFFNQLALEGAATLKNIADISGISSKPGVGDAVAIGDAVIKAFADKSSQYRTQMRRISLADKYLELYLDQIFLGRSLYTNFMYDYYNEFIGQANKLQIVEGENGFEEVIANEAAPDARYDENGNVIEQLLGIILPEGEGRAIISGQHAFTALANDEITLHNLVGTDAETASTQCWGDADNTALQLANGYTLESVSVWLSKGEELSDIIEVTATLSDYCTKLTFTVPITDTWELMRFEEHWVNGSKTQLASYSLVNASQSVAVAPTASPPEPPTGNGPVGTHPLNDTGVITCSDDISMWLPCPVDGFEGQDAEYGRDALAVAGQLEKVGAGHGGFDFTKLDVDGNDLPLSATEWSCVRDNVTKLVWETKTNDGGLRDRNHQYFWYNPDNNTNGGKAGTNFMSTYSFVQNVNAVSFCGASDWRLPTIEELYSIILNQNITSYLAIDKHYFPNTLSSNYWSSSPYSKYRTFAWCVSFSFGQSCVDYKSSPHPVRLVRAGN
jgi:hypothetical protein